MKKRRYGDWRGSARQTNHEKEISFFATKSDFIILISLQPDVEDLGYFKILILLKYPRFQ